jgi:hypothetical protein
MATANPFAARSRHIAFPIRLAPPVTSATFAASGIVDLFKIAALAGG